MPLGGSEGVRCEDVSGEGVRGEVGEGSGICAPVRRGEGEGRRDEEGWGVDIDLTRCSASPPPPPPPLLMYQLWLDGRKGEREKDGGSGGERGREGERERGREGERERDRD